MPSYPVTVNVKWKAITYNITYDKGTGSGTVPVDDLKYKGKDYTVSTSYPLKKDGYKQIGWKLTSESIDGKGAETTLTAEVAATLYPVWTPIEYSVTYILNAGTNSTNNPAAYTINEDTFKLSAPTRTGFTFLGWTYDKVTIPATDITIAKGSAGDKTFTANWQADTPTSKPDGYKLDSKTSTSITVSAPAGYEYSDNGTNWQSPDKDGKVMFTGLTAGETYILRCRVPENTAENQLAKASAEFQMETVKIMKTVAIPSVNSKTYTGSLQTADIIDKTGNDGYTVKENKGGIKAGSYDVVLALNNFEDYAWSDGTTADKKLIFTINKADNSWIKALSCSGFIYDGKTALAPVSRSEAGTVSYSYTTSEDGTLRHCQPEE